MPSLFSSPPEPPNPVQVAGAQTGTNVSTAVANAFLNNVNQVTPQGSLNYNQTGTFSWTDPSTGHTYNIPRFTAEQSLSPAQQQIQQLGDRTQINLGNLASNQSGMLTGLLGLNFNPAQGNFNAQQYLQQNPDVYNAAVASGQDPITFAGQHYRTFGQMEGRYGGGFDAQAYLNANPDVANAARASGADPQTFAVQHYSQFGRREGRTAGVGSPLAATTGGLQSIGAASGNIADVGQQTGTLRGVPGLQYGFDQAGNITRSYGPADNFSADRQRVEESLYKRMDPQMLKDEERLRQQLADQGIRYGSQAYNDAFDNMTRQRTDARLAVTAAGGTEQQRMMDMAAQEAGFQNAAQQQAYQQALGRGEFYNKAQVADYAQALQSGQFTNAAQQQAFAQAQARNNAYNTAQLQNMEQQKTLFNAQNQLRQQYLQEQYAQRQQPLNEISALMSGSQVSQPQFLNTPNSQIATTDVAGLINNRFNQDLALYNQQSQQMNQLLGGILGAGAGILSDRREKKDIDKIGTVLASGPNGEKPLPVYEYTYKQDPTGARHVGPMAQDVEKIDRSAVRMRGGRKYINATKLGSILKVA